MAQIEHLEPGTILKRGMLYDRVYAMIFLYTRLSMEVGIEVTLCGYTNRAIVSYLKIFFFKCVMVVEINMQQYLST